MNLHVVSRRRLDGGVLEREFLLGDVPGILWTPVDASETSPVPLVMLGQPGGLGMHRMRPALEGRARSASAHGLAAVAIELPGNGGRPTLPGAESVRAELRRVLSAGERPGPELVDRLILPLVERAVPEWQATLDACFALPELDGRAVYSGGVIAIGVRLAVVEPRILAACLFAGSYIPRATMSEATAVTMPLHVLLQWDDDGNDRDASLALFDAFASAEKTLHANMGGHTGVPAFAGEEVARFFDRHLAQAAD
ncbi:hypothetical protein HNR16_002598 [Pseudoclavibacter chungangensis]|uniref:alpha/beta hydrolase n=1 Tax=Pseudoclavibacter chungangensis TaxID=587635 RepID=UPI0018385838|nr:hypothetical protein [Pseudoclavibacter chungangensis]